MARKRKQYKLTHWDKEYWDLTLGRGRAEWNEIERREAWLVHKADLMASVNPGTRPAAFWDYEGFKKVPFESDLQALDRLGLLTERELDYFTTRELLPTEPATGEDPRKLLTNDVKVVF